MLKSLLGAVRKRANPIAPAIAGPYASDLTNGVYQNLFCDRLDLYRKARTITTESCHPWSTLTDEEPSLASLRLLAEDKAEESRVRLLAFHRLRGRGEEVKEKLLLGVVLELGVLEGLETIAAYSDGSARYLHHTGKIYIVQGIPNPFEEQIKAMIGSSKALIPTTSGVEGGGRSAPPRKGIVRMTFLMSDGHYSEEGLIERTQHDPKVSVYINSGARLLSKLIKHSEIEADPGDAVAEGAGLRRSSLDAVRFPKM